MVNTSFNKGVYLAMLVIAAIQVVGEAKKTREEICNGFKDKNDCDTNACRWKPKVVTQVCKPTVAFQQQGFCKQRKPTDCNSIEASSNECEGPCVPKETNFQCSMIPNLPVSICSCKIKPTLSNLCVEKTCEKKSCLRESTTSCLQNRNCEFSCFTKNPICANAKTKEQCNSSACQPKETCQIKNDVCSDPNSCDPTYCHFEEGICSFVNNTYCSRKNRTECFQDNLNCRWESSRCQPITNPQCENRQGNDCRGICQRRRSTCRINEMACQKKRNSICTLGASKDFCEVRFSGCESTTKCSTNNPTSSNQCPENCEHYDVCQNKQIEVEQCSNLPFGKCDSNECYQKNAISLNKSACAELDRLQCDENQKYCNQTSDDECKDVCVDKGISTCEKDTNCLWSAEPSEKDLECKKRQINVCNDSECEVKEDSIEGKCTFANIISTRLLLLIFLVFTSI